jgi:hypothetical protein
MALSADGARLVLSPGDDQSYALELSAGAWMRAACSILSAPADAFAPPRDRVDRICRDALRAKDGSLP